MAKITYRKCGLPPLSCGTRRGKFSNRKEPRSLVRGSSCESPAPPKGFSAGNCCRDRSCRSAVVPLLKQSLVHPLGYFAATHFALPFAMSHRIEALSRLIRLDIADELRNRFGIASDEDLLFHLERLLGFGPPLTQVTDGYGLHAARITCFTCRS